MQSADEHGEHHSAGGSFNRARNTTAWEDDVTGKWYWRENFVHEEKPVTADNKSAPWHFHPSESNANSTYLRNALSTGRLLDSECAEEWTAAIVWFMKNIAVAIFITPPSASV